MGVMGFSSWPTRGPPSSLYASNWRPCIGLPAAMFAKLLAYYWGPGPTCRDGVGKGESGALLGGADQRMNVTSLVLLTGLSYGYGKPDMGAGAGARDKGAPLVLNRPGFPRRATTSSVFARACQCGVRLRAVAHRVFKITGVQSRPRVSKGGGLEANRRLPIVWESGVHAV